MRHKNTKKYQAKQKGIKKICSTERIFTLLGDCFVFFYILSLRREIILNLSRQ